MLDRLGPDGFRADVGTETGHPDGMAEGDSRARRVCRDFHNNRLHPGQMHRAAVPCGTVEGRRGHFLGPGVLPGRRPQEARCDRCLGGRERRGAAGEAQPAVVIPDAEDELLRPGAGTDRLSDGC